ncbi:MAG: serine--tRNA ligase [Clostridiales bacterium]|jgi:seryl-tRNA synthetase|nr:serine--tRNA ligase [Clostridiales bacterium]
MLDLRFVTENIDYVRDALSKRNGKYPIEEIAALNEERRSLIRETERLKAKKNASSDEIAALKRREADASALIAEMKLAGEEIKELDAKLNAIESKLGELLYSVPNLPAPNVPAGKDDRYNVEIRRSLTPRVFGFEPKPHWDIGEGLNVLDWPRAAKISGARFTVYKGAGARLERAVCNLMLDTHTQNGYTEIFPPFMVNRDSMLGTGQLPKFEEDMFRVEGANYFLIPTAEVPVTNLHRNEILGETELPIKYCAYTACFRAEAGSAGRDTRGLIRQHQFNKVELVKFARPDDSFGELETLTNDAERILRILEIPYRVVLLCTGDTGFSSCMTYDIEVWMPSYNRYVEISSCSNFGDFQARRANIKFRAANGKTAYVHTLNGSGLAIGRTTAAILENFQNADGGVTIPDALRKYTGFSIIK